MKPYEYHYKTLPPICGEKNVTIITHWTVQIRVTDRWNIRIVGTCIIWWCLLVNTNVRMYATRVFEIRASGNEIVCRTVCKVDSDCEI